MTERRLDSMQEAADHLLDTWRRGIVPPRGVATRVRKVLSHALSRVVL